MTSEDQDILAKISQLAGTFGATSLLKTVNGLINLKAKSTVIRTSSSMLHILYTHKRALVCNHHITVG